MGLDYALLPKASGDPQPLVGSGKFYSKGPDGNVQAYYQDDAGNVYQLTPTTPATPTPNYQFIFDSGAVPSGNLYNDMGALLTAANALLGLKKIFLMTDTPNLTGTYDFRDCHIEAPYSFNTMYFTDNAVVSAMPLRLTNVLFRYTPTVANHILCRPGDTAPNLDLILEGYSGLICDNPPVGDSGRMFQWQGSNNLFIRHRTFVTGPNNPVDSPNFAMFAPDVGFGGTANIVMATQYGFAGDANQMFGGTGVRHEVYGYGGFFDLNAFTNGQLVAYLRASADNLTFADELVTTIEISANQLEYQSLAVTFGRFTRWNVTAACQIDGFDSFLTPFSIRGSNIANHMRWHFNVGTQPLTIVDASGSLAAPSNQVLTDTGANLVINPNERFWLWWDMAAERWRAGK